MVKNYYQMLSEKVAPLGLAIFYVFNTRTPFINAFHSLALKANPLQYAVNGFCNLTVIYDRIVQISKII